VKVDLKGETDLDKLADIALSFSARIREEDVHETRDHLIDLCFWHPVKAAQLMMAFAAMLDPEEGTVALCRRIEAVSTSRVAVLDKRIQRMKKAGMA